LKEIERRKFKSLSSQLFGELLPLALFLSLLCFSLALLVAPVQLCLVCTEILERQCFLLLVVYLQKLSDHVSCHFCLQIYVFVHSRVECDQSSVVFFQLLDLLVHVIIAAQIDSVNLVLVHEVKCLQLQILKFGGVAGWVVKVKDALFVGFGTKFFNKS
jgi:hypothetical protein